MKTEHVNALRNTYKEAIKCMLKLHVDAPLNLSELKFHERLQLQVKQQLSSNCNHLQKNIYSTGKKFENTSFFTCF